MRLGANWIKAEYITDFMEQVFKTPSYYIGSSIKATYSEISGAWNISGKSLDRSNPRVTNTYGTMRVNGYRLLEDALNLRDTKIYDTMEYSKEGCRLLEDCFTGKVDLIVTQKVSNVSSDWKEMSFMARMLAAQEHPVGIYFISEDIFTLASYYQADLRDTGLLPEGWQTLPADELDEPMLSTLPKPAMPERAEQLRLEEETNAME